MKTTIYIFIAGCFLTEFIYTKLFEFHIWQNFKLGDNVYVNGILIGTFGNYDEVNNIVVINTEVKE